MQLLCKERKGLTCVIKEDCAEIRFTEKKEKFYVELEHSLPFEADGTEYILLPSCCYDGNRFDVLKNEYGHFFTPEQGRVDMPVTITDVPRLEKDGSGSIEITTGDLSVPCIGIFSRKERKAVFLFTTQGIDGVNFGIAYTKGSVCLTYPHMRKKAMYRFMQMVPSTDTGKDFEAGMKVEIPYRLYEFSCDSLKEFYHFFFENRKCMGMDDKLPPPISSKKLFEIHKNRMNRDCWNDTDKFYGYGDQQWTVGWVGGGIYPYALMKLGGEMEWERGIQNLDFLFRTQAPCGLLYDYLEMNGKPNQGAYWGLTYAADYLFIRRSSDALYFIFKHFSLMKERGVEVPIHFEEGAKSLADVFVRIWKKYGQLGQIFNRDTGAMIVGGSDCAVMAIGGLVEAGVYFGNEEYVQVAKAIGEHYCKKVLDEGYTTGGPLDILQCPDSESAFALLESLAALYNRTGEERWLEYGKFMVEFCSSWVVAYNYRFPKNSEFGRLDMKSTGTVFANVQNKHAAPAICTHSAYAIYQFYQWTGDEKYLQLYREITGTMYQYVSREDRVIHSWHVPAKPLQNGWVCERVNMSDWEGDDCIGGVFGESSFWCEVASLLELADNPDKM